MTTLENTQSACFIPMASGGELDLVNPKPGQLTTLDIGWSLSQLNRFTGHALRPYSVAEHSLLVCEIMERSMPADSVQSLHHQSGLLAALMHDAHECITNDLHSPGKAMLGQAWRQWENQYASFIANKFALNTAFELWRDEIKRADLIALATERRDLIWPRTDTWECLEGIEPADWVNLHSPERRQMDWEDWRDRWLDKFHELEFGREEAARSTA